MGLLNGLSEAGKGIAGFAGEMGLSELKADLTRQSMVLADQLAGARESVGRKETAGYQAERDTKQNAFTGGESEKTRAAQVALENMRLGGTASEGRLNRENQITLEKMKLNAPPETIKLLRALGAIPDPDAVATSTPTNIGGSPTSSNAVENPSSVGEPPATTGILKGPDVGNPLVAKNLNLPMAGSEDAIRRAIAYDVGRDPEFKDKSPGLQAAEIEKRLKDASSQMTQDQARAATYADRMQASNAILKQVDNEGTSWIQRRLATVGDKIGTTGLNSEKFQKFEQAQRDFINATLRLESGAVISEAEFDSAKKQYFPQPGDIEARIKQKAANRERTITGFVREAGPSYKPPKIDGSVSEPTSAPASRPPLSSFITQ